MKERILLFVSPFFLLTLIFLGTGCMSWEEGWKLAAEKPSGRNTAALLARADRMARSADTEKKVLDLISAYGDVVSADPDNVSALSSLSSYYFLMGFGYSDTRSEKKDFYVRSIQAAERAMYTNPEFRKMIESGEETCVASAKLTDREMNALMHYYLAVGCMWDECLSLPGKIINMGESAKFETILNNMVAINQDWGNGSVYMLLGTFYSVLPGILGGDLDRAAENFDRAVNAGPRMLSFRETRAKVLYTKLKDRDAFVRDLESVVAQDPADTESLEYAWAVWHRNNAKKMLANVDSYF